MVRRHGVIGLVAALIVLCNGLVHGGIILVAGFEMPTGASHGYVLVCDAAGVGTWQPAPGGGGNDSDWTILGSNMYAAVSGNVGIGTPTPTAKLEVDGDVKVNGALRGNVGPNNGAPFPRPAYDSGWVACGPVDPKVFSHNLGGGVDNYVVHATGKSADGRSSTGGWRDLTSQTVTVVIENSDTSRCRVRIWVIR